MQLTSICNKQTEELGVLLEDMKNYLYKLEQGCQGLPVMFYTDDKAKALENLLQIMEGLNYYQKLLKSTAILLNIDCSEVLYEKMSITVLFEQLSQMFTNIYEVTENEDYSLLSDIIEYDLTPAICNSQGILAVVQGRNEERIM